MKTTIFNIKRVKVLLLALLITSSAFAQGDGPNMWPLVPKGMTIINPLYINLRSNITASQDFVSAKGLLNINVVPLAYAKSFSMNGRFGQLFFIPAYGSIKGNVELNGQSFNVVKQDGFMDPALLFRVGLVNAPALDIIGFVQHVPKFELYAVAGTTLPLGKYDATRRVNLGTNRWSFRVGFPFVVPFNKNIEKPFRWEVAPTVSFYTANNAPYNAGQKKQSALFVTESHLTNYFTKKLWASFDTRYQVGGRTKTDGIKAAEQINELGMGASVGYTLLEPLILYGSYGGIVGNDNGHMFRLSAILVIPSKKDMATIKQMKQQPAK